MTERSPLPDPSICPSTKLVWLWIRGQRASRFEVNISGMCRALGINRRTAHRALHALEDNGFIGWQRGLGGRPADQEVLQGREWRCGVITVYPRDKAAPGR